MRVWNSPGSSLRKGIAMPPATTSRAPRSSVAATGYHRRDKELDELNAAVD